VLLEHARLEAVEERQRRLAHVGLGVGERGDRGGGVGLHRRRRGLPLARQHVERLAPHLRRRRYDATT